MEICQCCKNEITRFKTGEAFCNGSLCNAEGDYVIAASDDWRIWNQGKWRQMTIEEQLEKSK